MEGSEFVDEGKKISHKTKLDEAFKDLTGDLRGLELNGVILERKIISWIEKKGYDLKIGRVNGRQSHVSWRIEDVSDNRSALTIKVHPWMMNQGNKLFQFLPFQLFVKPQLKLYLKSVLRGLKWYTKHNKPTPRNHFGKLAWFS